MFLDVLVILRLTTGAAALAISSVHPSAVMSLAFASDAPSRPRLLVVKLHQGGCLPVLVHEARLGGVEEGSGVDPGGPRDLLGHDHPRGSARRHQLRKLDDGSLARKPRTSSVNQSQGLVREDTGGGGGGGHGLSRRSASEAWTA